MNKIKKTFLSIVQGFVLCAAALQIILSIGYICLNFAAVPQFQDTVIYTRMAEQFAADEYTGLLYPLWVNICSGIPLIPYQIPIYLLQISAGVLSVYTFVFTWIPNKTSAVICAVWINTSPFIAQAHMTVLPHSLAMSCMLYMLLQVMKGCVRKRSLYAAEWVKLSGAYIVLTQLTGGYLAVGTLFIVWAALLQFYANKNRMLLFAVSILACAGIFAMNLSVYRMTESEGYYGRMPKTISATLFKRAGVLTFSGKYLMDMPAEMKDDYSDIDIDDMQRYPYKIESELHQALTEKYGKERTNQIYWELGMLGIKTAAKSNLAAYIEDSADYMLPIAAYHTWCNGEVHGATSWNYQQFMKQAPWWSAVYIKICHLFWDIGIAAGVVIYLITSVKNKNFKLHVWIPSMIYIVIYAAVMALNGTNVYDYKLAVLPAILSCILICIMFLRSFFIKD